MSQTKPQSSSGRVSQTSAKTAGTWSRRAVLAAAGSGLALSGCARIEQILTPREPPLPGRRLSVLTDSNAIDKLNAKALVNPRVTLDTPLTNKDWNQVGSQASRAKLHYAIADAPRRLWTLRFGDGNRRRQKLTSSPLIINKTIFVIDSTGNVSARRIADGQQYWRRSVLPAGESSGFGGALAYADGRLHV